MKPTGLLFSSFVFVAGLMSLQAQTAPATSASSKETSSAFATVVAVGSFPKSVVKWSAKGDSDEYVLANPDALPPAGLYVQKAGNADLSKKYETFPMTLNAPTKPCAVRPEGIVLYQKGAEQTAGKEESYQQAMVIPALQGKGYQMVFMWRKNAKGDWKTPEYYALDLAESNLAQGEILFLNLTQLPARVNLPQSKRLQPLGYRQPVKIAQASGAPNTIYKIEVSEKDKVETVAATGMRNLPGRSVVVIYTGTDGKTISSRFDVPENPAKTKPTEPAPPAMAQPEVNPQAQAAS